MSTRRRLQLESLELRRLLATTTIDAEPNNTAAQAQVFTFGDDGVALLQGTSASKDDKDYFRFTAPASGTLQANLTNKTASLEIDNLLEVEPHDGVTSATASVVAGQLYLVRLRSVEKTAADYAATLTFTAGDVPPATGTPSVDDHGSGGHGSDDGGTVGGTPPTVEDPSAEVIADAEPNNSRGTSQRFTLTGSTRLEGTASQADRDFFAFAVPADGNYTVGVRSLTGDKVDVEIEDQFGHNVLELEPQDGVSSGVAELVSGRTYFLRVKSDAVADATYAIDLQPSTATITPPADPTVVAAAAQQAAINQLDTDGDDAVSPLDALSIINYLNSHSGHSEQHDLLELIYDMDDDGYVSPVDALQVINYLNSGSSASKLAVTTPADPTAPASAPPVDPTQVGSTTSDDPATHDLNDDHGVDAVAEADDSGSDGSSDQPLVAGGAGVASDSSGLIDDHGVDADYASSVDDLLAEYEREFEHVS